MNSKGEATRRQIIDTAREMLRDHGLGSFVLRDVAERLGLSPGNVQYYFGTRHELLLAVFDRELGKYTESMTAAVARARTPRARLDAIIDSGLAQLQSPDTPLWWMMVAMSSHNREMAAILERENNAYKDAVANELQHIAPSLSLKRRRQIAIIVQAMLDGISVQRVRLGSRTSGMREVDEQIRTAVRALVEGA